MEIQAMESLEVKEIVFGFGEINKQIDIVIMNIGLVYFISCYVCRIHFYNA